MLTYNPSTKKILYEEDDSLLGQATKLIVKTGKASASLIQRHFKLGYARSARIIDQMEQKGIIGPADGARPRQILAFCEDGKWKFTSPPKPKKVEPIEEPPIPWRKTKYVQNKTDHFEIDLGVDEENKLVKFNLEKYGNLFIVGSQFTSVVDLLNGILATSMARYSPEELRLLAIDGVIGDLIVPNKISHLLTPLIVDLDKPVSALKWLVAEIERRARLGNQKDYPNILLMINSYCQMACFSPTETENSLYRIISQGKKYGVYVVISNDHPKLRLLDEIMANIPAKLIFKPTNKKIARQTGIPESIDLTSPDEAILETMYEGKKKLTINKVNSKEIYEEIFK